MKDCITLRLKHKSNMKIKFLIRRKLRKKKESYFILSKKDLAFLESELSKNKVIGIDTEFDWRTTYFPILSIIQISTKDNVFIVDCLKNSAEKVLKKYLEDINYLKIFHSARSDATVLSNSLNCKINNVFDIQIADKFLSGDEIKSYGKIVNKHFGIKLDKTETNSNWLKRPLSDDQIKYAFDDVDFLIEIYKFQIKALDKQMLLEVLKSSKKEAYLGSQPLKYSRLNKIQNKSSERDINIFIWREELAESKNIPPAHIVKDKYLRKLSKIKPHDVHAKRKIMTIFGDTTITKEFISNFL